ncbi:MAG: hypothetical protein M9921_09440 [Fimbriimonadaceae bacterium]|nr:hypothetical protein [Chthonomonadaceae bacterium]MCO5297066.1 hypothetical protein [Fimbriimonadaceae bacterium]
MFTFLPAILALSVASAAQDVATNWEVFALGRMRSEDLVAGYPVHFHNGAWSKFELAVAAHATTRHLREVVSEREKLLRDANPGPDRDGVVKMIQASSGWRYLFADLRRLTVMRRYELEAMEINVDALLTSQSEYVRRYLVLTAQANGPFVDVPNDHWASEAVEELRLAGILVGNPDLSFQGGLPELN